MPESPSSQPPPPVSQGGGNRNGDPPPPEHPPPPDDGRGTTPWSPLAVLVGLGVAIGTVLVATGIVAAFDPEIESAAARLASQGAFELSIIAVAIAFAGAGPLRTRLVALGLRPFAVRALGTAALAYLLYLGVAVLWALLVQPEQEDVTRELGGGEGTLATVLAGVMIVGLAPLGEEIFIRGFMFGGLRGRWGMWPAAIVTGIFFGALHYTGPDSLGVVPQLAFFGVLLAWLYDRTGSLWPPIAMHTLNNALAFSIALTL